MKHCQFEALQSYPSDDTLQKLVLLHGVQGTREPLLARRLLLDKVRAGQEKAALEEAAAARDAGAGGAGGSAADAMHCHVTVICNGYTVLKRIMIHLIMITYI